MNTTQQGTGISGSEPATVSGENASRMTQRAHEAVDRVASSAHGLADRMTHQGEKWIARQDEMMHEVRGYVRERPIAALAIAAAVGFVLSRLSR